MKEHLAALVYILVIAGACFLVMAKPLTARVMAPADFARRRNLWIAVTVATFLAHNYWLAMLASALIVGFGARREQNPAALYCALLFAVPQFLMQIPGLGLVNQLFEIDHPRMLALVLLLPAAVRLASEPRVPNPRLQVPDALFVAYFLYVFLAHATTDSVTGLMRYTVYVLLDHALLYYVVTRSVTDRRRFYDVLASFTMAVAVAALIGGFENMRRWLVYESLREPLGVPFETIGTYLLRVTEDGDYLRAYTTMGHAIAFGYVCMIALAWQLALIGRYAPKALGWGVVAMLVVGLLSTVSRGPWLGCAVAIVAGLSFGPGAGKRLLWMLGLLPILLAALLILPQGQKFIDLLPFVGSVESGNVTYRAQLIERALIVFWQNPIFGSLQFIYNPMLEEMRQGQGIIDIVNSYVGVALAYGSVGLMLFVALPAWALVASVLTSQRLASRDADAGVAGRALAASLLGSLLVIGTASQIFHIPVVHWLAVGLCVTFAVGAPAWQRAPAGQLAPMTPTSARTGARPTATARRRF